jgi:hypothetical protein
MNILEKIGLELIHIPEDIRAISTTVGNETIKLQAELQSNAAIDIAAVVDAALGTTVAETVRQDGIAICTTAIAGCKALQGISDTAGVAGRLKRLGTDLTQLAHASNQHSFAFYDECFETVINDLLGKAA